MAVVAALAAACSTATACLHVACRLASFSESIEVTFVSMRPAAAESRRRRLSMSEPPVVGFGGLLGGLPPPKGRVRLRAEAAEAAEAAELAEAEAWPGVTGGGAGGSAGSLALDAAAAAAAAATACANGPLIGEPLSLVGTALAAAAASALAAFPGEAGETGVHGTAVLASSAASRAACLSLSRRNCIICS